MRDLAWFDNWDDYSDWRKEDSGAARRKDSVGSPDDLQDEPCCEHGVAWDVYCPGCHSGWFDGDDDDEEDEEDAEFDLVASAHG